IGKVGVGGLTKKELKRSKEPFSLATYGEDPEDEDEDVSVFQSSPGVCWTKDGIFFKVMNSLEEVSVFQVSLPLKLYHVLVVLPLSDLTTKIKSEKITVAYSQSINTPHISNAIDTLELHAASLSAAFLLQSPPGANSTAPDSSANGATTNINNNNTKLMISYSWDDKAVVHFVAQVLKDNKFEVWIDKTNMQVQLNDAIAQAINWADAVIVFISESSAKSYYCKKEISYATDRRKAIVPVRLTTLPISVYPTLDFLTAGQL
ncbi:hypothetical protein HK100_009405, partial [Physocladia obscura]